MLPFHGRRPLASHERKLLVTVELFIAEEPIFHGRKVVPLHGHFVEEPLIDNNTTPPKAAPSVAFQQRCASGVEREKNVDSAKGRDVVAKQDALAVDGEFGLLEGKTFDLIHPIVMASLFFYTLWARYLGWQWWRVRSIKVKINELKKQVKPTLVTPEGKPLEAPPSLIELKIQQLTEVRKELLKGSYRDMHYNAGSILLGFGVLEAVGGGLNTWIRTRKLFLGQHLFTGVAITVLWALATALVHHQCRKGMKQLEVFTLR